MAALAGARDDGATEPAPTPNRASVVQRFDSGSVLTSPTDAQNAILVAGATPGYVLSATPKVPVSNVPRLAGAPALRCTTCLHEKEQFCGAT